MYHFTRSILIYSVLIYVMSMLFILSAANSGISQTFFAEQLIFKYGSNGTLNVDQLNILLKDLKRENGAKTLGHGSIQDTNTAGSRISNCTNSNNSVILTDSTCLKQQCLSGKDIFSFYSYSSSASLDKNGLEKISSAILYQAQNSECDTVSASRHKKPSAAEVWGYGFLFVTIISVCALVGVLFIPFMKRSFYKILLMFMVALAVGSLAGSGLLVLIPEALGLVSDDNPPENYVYKGSAIFGGVFLFFIIERIMKMIMDAKEEKQVGAGNVQLNSVTKKRSDETNTPLNDLPVCSIKTHNHLDPDPHLKIPPANLYACQFSKSESAASITANGSDGKTESVTSEKPNNGNCDLLPSVKVKRKIAPVAWMIIFGDGLHNFIDGLSIGAAFSQNLLTGISISVAVICEELPHELGDFAILLNSGMSMREALGFNFLSACCCYVGLAIGIILGELTSATLWIFAVAGGMFLYISLVDMMPEVNHAAEDEENANFGKCTILFIQICGLLLGFGIMFVMALYGGEIQFG